MAVRAAKALEEGDVATAEAIYRERVAKYPKDPSGHKALGAALLFQKQYQAARAEYEAAVRLDANYADAHYGLGCVAYETGSFPEARGHLEKAVGLKKHESYHRLLAMVYDQLRDDAKALFHYEQADALRGNRAEDEHVKKRLSELRR
jgi:tetratricopeptide (TPR) repeat protein